MPNCVSCVCGNHRDGVLKTTSQLGCTRNPMPSHQLVLRQTNSRACFVRIGHAVLFGGAVSAPCLPGRFGGAGIYKVVLAIFSVVRLRWGRFSAGVTKSVSRNISTQKLAHFEKANFRLCIFNIEAPKRSKMQSTEQPKC